jgi:acyl-CoA thioesterase FadM
MTREISVRYLKTVPTNTEILVEAQITNQSEKNILFRSTVHNSEGILLTESESNWMFASPAAISRATAVNESMLREFLAKYSQWLLTAFASYYKDKTAQEQENAPYWFATGSLKSDLLKPVAIDKPVQIRARIKEKSEKKFFITCSLFSEGEERARGEVLAVRVPAITGPKKEKWRPFSISRIL